MNLPELKLSIIIPTLNEGQYLENTLLAIKNHAGNSSMLEVILVDSGSSDNTVTIANDQGVRVFVKPEFKGMKYLSLNFGASHASADVLMFLDADCTVPQNFDLALLDLMQMHKVVGGAFEFSSDDRSYAMRAIELLNQIRYRISPTYFGDQGVFCKREAFNAIGGFPEEPIMESAYFCVNLRKTGNLKLVKRNVITSARRFKEGGILMVMIKDSWIWLQFILGLNIKRYAGNYWKENEKRGYGI